MSLVRERDRGGLSFYFVYDGRDRFARCVRTWGDDGISDHVIDYDRAALATLVTHSLGEITRYQMDGLGMVIEILQADGTSVRREYEPTTWLAAEIDESGAATRYQYDERGNRVMTVEPKGDAGPRVTKVRYDAKDRPIELVDPTGATWAWRYDGAGRVVARVDPLGHTTVYVWEKGDLVGVVDATGPRTALEYGGAHELAALTAADGGVARWQYDATGRVVAQTDAKGNVARRRVGRGRSAAVDRGAGRRGPGAGARRSRDVGADAHRRCQSRG